VTKPQNNTGTEITARHFIPGQLVDVQGKTFVKTLLFFCLLCFPSQTSFSFLVFFFSFALLRKGKGFQGAMKRWGFAGLPASHGTSIAHRSLGATGARQVGQSFPDTSFFFFFVQLNYVLLLLHRIPAKFGKEKRWLGTWEMKPEQ
jgi:hypothetical protein